MISMDFERSDYHYFLYIVIFNNIVVYVILYVNDLLICSVDADIIAKIKEILSKRFGMKDLGQISQYLGIGADYDTSKRKMFLSPEK